MYLSEFPKSCKSLPNGWRLSIVDIQEFGINVWDFLERVLRVLYIVQNSIFIVTYLIDHISGLTNI